MEHRKFGWTGLDIPVIGQGTWMIEGPREKEQRSIAALRAGIALGMTHIDTAEMYGSGRAEELVREAISPYPRDSVFLVSKVLPSNASYDGTLAACERSLARLGTDYVDLYLLHWPSSHPITETMRAMERLIDEKQIRYAGVSNFDVAQLQSAERAMKRHRLVCNQVLYHLGERGIERKLIPYCAEREIAVVAYSPFGHGGLQGGRVLEDIGRRHNRTARQVVLNFLTRLPHVFTIPKSSQTMHTTENAGGAGWRLDEQDLAAIDRAFPAPSRDVPLGMI